jgi:hypothetical protein
MSVHHHTLEAREDLGSFAPALPQRPAWAAAPTASPTQNPPAEMPAVYANARAGAAMLWPMAWLRVVHLLAIAAIGVATVFLASQASTQAWQDSEAFTDLLRDNRAVVTAGAMAAGVALLSFLMWAMVAARNAQALTPLALSPWMTPFVYLVGPAVAVVGYRSLTDGSFEQQLVIGVGAAIFCLGAWLLPLSFRATAQRLGAARQPWTTLFLLPILSNGVGLASALAIGSQSSVDRQDQLVLVNVIAQAIVGAWFATTHIQAMVSFERGLSTKALAHGPGIDAMPMRFAART